MQHSKAYDVDSNAAAQSEKQLSKRNLMDNTDKKMKDGVISPNSGFFVSTVEAQNIKYIQHQEHARNSASNSARQKIEILDGGVKEKIWSVHNVIADFQDNLLQR